MVGNRVTPEDEQRACAVGVDAGGTKIAAGVVDLSGSITTRARVATPPAPGEALSALRNVVRHVLEAHRGAPVAGVGLGLPGLVARDAGRFVYGPNFPLRDVEVAAAVSADTGLEVLSANESSAAAVAEHRVGAGRGTRDMLYVALGTGIGGGVVSGGRLLDGAHGYAGEFGHMVVDREGPMCTCGRSGCWETVASGRALAALVGAIGEPGPEVGAGPPVDARSVFAAAARGDARELEIVDRFARAVASGLQNLVQAFDPELIVLGGGLVSLGDLLLDPVRERLDACLSGRAHRDPPQVVASRFGVDAALVGAGRMVLERQVPSDSASNL